MVADGEGFYDDAAVDEVIEAAAQDTAKWQHRTTQTLFAVAILAVAVGFLAYFAIKASNERQDINHGLATLAGRQARLAGRQAEQATVLAKGSKKSSTRVVKFLQGTRGLPGIPGSSGGAGFPGPIGATGGLGGKGVAGVAGAGGETGAAGAAGAAGTAGTAGTNGAQGVQGPQGDQGPPGNTGNTGPEPGSFTFVVGATTYTCTDGDGDGNYDCASSP